MEILLGIIAGICTGIGIGGGAILIPLLDIFLGLDQHLSQAINLICFIPSSIVSIIYNSKRKNINFSNVYMIAIFGIIGAIIGSLISKNMNVKNLKHLFGIFLIIISLYEIFDLYKYIKNKKVQ